MPKGTRQRQETPEERFDRVTTTVMNRQRKRKDSLAKQKQRSSSGTGVRQSSHERAV